MTKTFISTTKAPAAIGVYSQAVIANKTLYISGQIPLVPDTMEIISEDIEQQINQVFDNLVAVCTEAGAKLDDAIKFNVYLTDLTHFPKVNAAMEQRLAAPYPARAVVEVSGLPKGVQVEVDAIVDLS